MGTRLYVIGTSEEKEVVYGLPKGSWEKMKEITSKYEGQDSCEAWDNQKAELKASGCILADIRETYGFGKLNGAHYRLIKEYNLDQCGGGTTDRELIRKMLCFTDCPNFNNIDFDSLNISLGWG